MSARNPEERSRARAVGHRLQRRRGPRVSVPVELSALEAEIARHGDVAFLVTTSAGGRPHVVSVQVAVGDGVLTMGAGRSSRRNAAEVSAVTLLWADTPEGEYCLLVDGDATVIDDAERIDVQPTSAILHRLAGARADIPYCAPVGDA